MLRREPDVAKAQVAFRETDAISPERFRMTAQSVARLAQGLQPPDPKAIQLVRRLTELEPGNSQYHEFLAYLLRKLPEGQTPMKHTPPCSGLFLSNGNQATQGG